MKLLLKDKQERYFFKRSLFALIPFERQPIEPN